jgi:enoyl-CoA hydratase/carnithine racemase
MNSQNEPLLSDCRFERNGRVAILTFARDDVRNELTGTKIAADICSVVDFINLDSSISVLVLIGEGSAFSSGGNIKDMKNKVSMFGGDVFEVQEGYRRGIQRIPLALDRLEVPSIAAINGAAIGAGFDLACMCDVRIASANAVMGETFVNVGIIPGDGGAWFLQRLIGYLRATELTFSGRRFSAQEALTYGLLLEITPDAQSCRSRALEMAQAFASKPPRTLRLTKRLMKAAQRVGLSDFLDQSAALQSICHNSEDHLEALEAILAKRMPEFVGR